MLSKRTVQVNQVGADAPAKRVYLVVSEGAGLGATFDLSVERATIGRSPEASVRLEDDQLSRFHAILIRREDGYEIRDLHSTNGTSVNGKRVDGATLLAHGDHIRFGTTTLRYLIEKTTEGKSRIFVVPTPPS